MLRLARFLVFVLAVTAVVDAEQLRLRSAASAGGGGGGGSLLAASDIITSNVCGYRATDTFNGAWSEASPGVIAFNDAATDTLYNVSRKTVTDSGYTFNIPVVAELGFPACNTYVSAVSDLNKLTYVQGYVDPIENGHTTLTTMDGCTLAERQSGACNPAGINGMLVSGGSLYLTYGVNYDGNNNQMLSHVKRPLNLSTTGSVSGPTRFSDGTGVGHTSGGGGGFTGFTAGVLAAVPASRATALGGSMASGWCCPSIISRSSHGPALGGFDPADIGGVGTKAWQPWVLYPSEHTTLGAWLAANPYFNVSTAVKGAVIFDGTDTVGFFGQWGETFCYGEPTSNQAWHDQDIDPDGGGPAPTEHYCYTLTSGAKANHGYPDHYSMWLYDINDFIAVKNGTKNAWDVVPYSRVNVTFPVSPSSTTVETIVGAAWDPVNKHLYLSQALVDQATGTANGLLWRYTVNIP